MAANKRRAKTYAGMKRAGTRAENIVKHSLEGLGYMVQRSWGSLGAFDLIAIGPGPSVYLIECKYGSARMSPEERKRLIQLGTTYNCVPIYAHYDGGVTTYKRLNADDTTEPWTPTDIRWALGYRDDIG
jgi:hypothetical protein